LIAFSLSLSLSDSKSIFLVNENDSNGIFFKIALTASDRAPSTQQVTYCQTVNGPVPKSADPIVSFNEP
jgi:hypothetical protein